MKRQSCYLISNLAFYDEINNAIFLNCIAHGRPQTNWLKDDHAISNNRYRLVEETGGFKKLVIRNPISSDAGIYSCYLESNDRIDAVSKNIKILDLKMLMERGSQETNIIPPENQLSSYEDNYFKIYKSSTRKPLFSLLLHNRVVTEGSNLRLVCSVVGDCETQIAWLKNNRDLPVNFRCESTFINGEASLDIISIEKSDSGVYSCRAKNTHGETFTNAQVRVDQTFEEATQPVEFMRSIKGTDLSF